MRFLTRIYVWVGLFVLLQLSFGAEKPTEECQDEDEKTSELNEHVEEIMKNILNLVKDFYSKIRKIYECVPDKIAEPAIDILKFSIDCVSDIERKRNGMRVTKKGYQKIFLRCLAQGKKKVESLTSNIDPAVNLCPENVTEKTYQIDVRTVLKKAIDINFKKGTDVIQKTIVFEAEESNLKDEDRGSLEEDNECGTEKVKPPAEDEEENLSFPSVDYIDENVFVPKNNRDNHEEFASTDGLNQGEMQMRKTEEENEKVGDAKKERPTVNLSGEILT